MKKSSIEKSLPSRSRTIRGSMRIYGHYAIIDGASSADDSRLLSRGNSQSPSSAATYSISVATVAEYHEWALQIGSAKRTMIGDDIINQIQFNHKDHHNLLALQIPDDRSRERASARSTRSHRATNHVKKKALVRRRGGKHSVFTSEDDELLIDLKEKQCLRSKDIAKEFPGKSANTLQVRYCTRLGRGICAAWMTAMPSKTYVHASPLSTFRLN